MAYKHILAAVDLSEESTQVLDKARDAAQSHDARLSLLTIVTPLSQVYGGLDMARGMSFEEEALQQAEAQLKELGGAYAVADENIHVIVGAPSSAIREWGKEHGVDLIVIGTHGRHGLGLLLGSTTNGVLHGVDCDVLAVRVNFDD